jgi:multiple sugar transport system ATP-binding protein
MTMGDRVAVMRKAELQQVAPPQELYDHPVNMFVAGFIGSPAMNMLEARIDRRDGQLVVVFGSTTITLDEANLAKHPALTSFAGRDVVLGIRPEDLEDAALSDGDKPRLAARVTLREALGSEVLAHFTIDARQAMTDEMRELAEDVGDDRSAKKFAGPAMTVAALVGRFSPRTKVAEGDTLEVSIDQHALHFFDPDTGAAIYGEDGRR